jgi:two-component system, NarL family, nitrate/nitrite response regulator NarL
VAAALSQSPDISVVAQTEAGDTALDEIRRHRPTVAVLDVRRPGCDGPSIMGALLQDGQLTRIVILSDSVTGPAVYATLAAGASGCVSKSSDAEELRRAVTAVARGEVFVSPGLMNDVVAEIRHRAPADRDLLSPRERAILELVAQGCSSREIGERLYLAPSTVKTYLHRVYQKLGVRGHTAAVVEALRRGLIGELEPDPE